MSGAAQGSRPALVCLDVDGTLTDGVTGPALPGAVEAVARLRGVAPVRLVTNTTSLAHRTLSAHLASLGLLADPWELVTPASMASRVLPARGHDRGLLLVDDGAREDFAWFREDPSGPAVVLGTEGHRFSIGDLQPVFRRLLDGGAFYALQQNRYFRPRGGELVTDLGPLAAFLACASGVQAVTLGKPSPLLFDELARDARCSRAEIVMVGDDAEVDAAASVALGMKGVLVRTGKYREGDEDRAVPRPSAVMGSVAELPAWL